ncbi:MAG: fructose-6-phosphate aldolase [Clostridiales bacterium]|nr:fructose-6-phosphate aldolase [Clostridiales bacterium]
MQYLLDTANLDQIRECFDLYPIEGVTTNPSILKAEGDVPLGAHLRAIRALCGPTRSLHVQLLARDSDGLLGEAARVAALLGPETYVKIPVTEQGLKAIRLLKARGVRVTATSVYSLAQGLLAVAAGADYLAPYCNRMEALEIDFRNVIEDLRALIDRDGYATRIVAASFKNMGQVNDALACGAHAVTLAPDLLRAPCASPLVRDTVSAFEKDFAIGHGAQDLIGALEEGV